MQIADYIRWLEEHKPGTARWIARRGGWDGLKPRAKAAIKKQVREGRRKQQAATQEEREALEPGQVIWGDSWDLVE
jgi:hypothetical protein